ncbi:MAG: hypothetical protein ACTSSH_00095 [Candidatus Heimdallarchaeota archaeon]
MSKATKKKKTEVEMPKPKQSKLRKVILETDGNMVRVSVNETSGNLELVSMLQAVIGLIAKS